MVGIHASAHSAQVIEVEFLWDRFDEYFVDDTMGRTRSALVLHPSIATSVYIRVPEPTTSCFIHNVEPLYACTKAFDVIG